MRRDIDRIRDLPLRAYVADAEAVERWRASCLVKPGGALLPSQIAFLEALRDAYRAPQTDNGAPGVLGLLPCGTGKTLALQLAATFARRPLLILPRSLVGQLHEDRRRYARDFRILASASESLGGDGDYLRLLTYGGLSAMSGRDALEEARPDLILLDEAHKLGRGARFARLWRYVSRHRGCRVVAVTGSLTGRSIADFHPLALLALRDWCPLPIRAGVLASWQAVLDVGGEPSVEDRRAIRPLVEWAGTSGPREAFATRLRLCPGVVTATGPLDVGVSLALARIDPRAPASPDVRIALEGLEAAWELPDGTELVDTLEVHRARRSLRLGFYHRWEPGARDAFADWFAARAAWQKALRSLVEYGPWETRGYAEAAARGGRLRDRELTTWRTWDGIRDEGPARETVWVDDGRTLAALLEDVGPDSIVWYRSRAIGEWARARGYAVATADDPPPTPGAADGPAFASMAHATGWNGQAYSDAIVLEPPSGARDLEQLLARHHRAGQTDDVTIRLLGDERDVGAWRARARYVAETTGAPMRVLLGDWCAPITGARNGA